MKHSNTPDGFSFIEIILTIALIGAVITPLAMVQYNVVGLLGRNSGYAARVFIVEQIMNEALQQLALGKEPKELATTKKLNDPAMNITLEVRAPYGPLQKLKGLYLIRIRSTWTQAGKERDMTMIRMVYHPEKKGEKKEKQSQAPSSTSAKGAA